MQTSRRSDALQGNSYPWLGLVQVGIFQVMLLQRSADRAYSVLQPMEPFLPFRDASMGASTFDLTVLHCIRVRPAPHPP